MHGHKCLCAGQGALLVISYLRLLLLVEDAGECRVPAIFSKSIRKNKRICRRQGIRRHAKLFRAKPKAEIIDEIRKS